MFDQTLNRSLHPNMRWIWVIRGLVVTLVLATMAAGAAAVVAAVTEQPPRWAIPLTVVGVGLLLSILWPRWAWQRWRWDVTDLALTLRHGVVVRHVRALPFFRIQHVDTNQGPLDRALGLTALMVHTASITSRLPGIATEDADALRQDLLRRAAEAARRANTDGDVDAV